MRTPRGSRGWRRRRGGLTPAEEGGRPRRPSSSRGDGGAVSGRRVSRRGASSGSFPTSRRSAPRRRPPLPLGCPCWDLGGLVLCPTAGQQEAGGAASASPRKEQDQDAWAALGSVQPLRVGPSLSSPGSRPPGEPHLSRAAGLVPLIRSGVDYGELAASTSKPHSWRTPGHFRSRFLLSGPRAPSALMRWRQTPGGRLCPLPRAPLFWGAGRSPRDIRSVVASQTSAARCRPQTPTGAWPTSLRPCLLPETSLFLQLLLPDVP